MTALGGITLSCPASAVEQDRVQIGHGSGGRMSAALTKRCFLPRFNSPTLDRLGDGAVVNVGSADIVVSTDTFVVTPLEFPGGDIGSLAVHGTLNDLAMMGATPVCITAGFVLEEGLSLDLLDRVVASMGNAARAAGVEIVAGDTKVVERGKADGVYINTTGIGAADAAFRPAPDRARAGQVILVSAPIARHGMAVMSAREGLSFETTITSDSASLAGLVERLREARVDVRVLRDPTRGGVASVLNEIATASEVGIEIAEAAIPVPDDVRAACEMLGIDPLYVANEGVLIAMVPAEHAPRALRALRSHVLGREACQIGRVTSEHPGIVTLRTSLGGRRIVDLLPGDLLPRIC